MGIRPSRLSLKSPPYGVYSSKACGRESLDMKEVGATVSNAKVHRDDGLTGISTCMAANNQTSSVYSKPSYTRLRADEPKKPSTRQNAAAKVFQSLHECVRLMVSYQSGLHGDLLPRFHERFLTVPVFLHGSFAPFHALPPSFRALKCTVAGFLSMDKLYLSKHHLDERFPLHLAIAEGDISLAKRILSCKADLLTFDALLCAVSANNTNMVEWVLPLIVEAFPTAVHDHSHRLMEKAIDENSFEMVQCLHRLGVPLQASYFCLPRLLELKRTRIARYFLDHNCLPRSITSAQIAIQCKNFPLFREITAGFTKEWKYLANELGLGGDLDTVMKAICYVPLHAVKAIFLGAVKAGSTQVLRWLSENCNERGSPACLTEAIRHGNVDLFRWLVQLNGNQMDPFRLEEPTLVTDDGFIHSLCTLGVQLDQVAPGSMKVARALSKLGVHFNQRQFDAAIAMLACDGCNIPGKERYDEEQVNIARHIISACPSITVRIAHVHAAIKHGSSTLVDFLSSICLDMMDDRVYFTAIGTGNLEMLHHLYDVYKFPIEWRHLRFALQLGHMAMAAFCIHQEES